MDFPGSLSSGPALLICESAELIEDWGSVVLMKVRIPIEEGRLGHAGQCGLYTVLERRIEMYRPQEGILEVYNRIDGFVSYARQGRKFRAVSFRYPACSLSRI